MIIGINGYIGSGKDTVGMIIQALTSNGAWADKPKEYIEAYEGRPNLKGGFEIKKFAGKLKQIASLMTGIPVEKFEDQEFKKTELSKEWWTKDWNQELPITREFGKIQKDVPMTVRDFLQKLGTEAIRNGLHENAWVNALFADYEIPISWDRSDIKKEYPNWIITDVRFPNEAKAIKEKGGILIRVVRDEIITGSFMIGKNGFKCISGHPSETSLDDWDFDHIIRNDGTIEQLIEKVKKII